MDGWPAEFSGKRLGCTVLKIKAELLRLWS